MRMAWLGGMALCAVFTAVQAEIKTEEVSYKDGDTVMKGFSESIFFSGERKYAFGNVALQCGAQLVD